MKDLLLQPVITLLGAVFAVVVLIRLIYEVLAPVLVPVAVIGMVGCALYVVLGRR